MSVIELLADHAKYLTVIKNTAEGYLTEATEVLRSTNAIEYNEITQAVNILADAINAFMSVDELNALKMGVIIYKHLEDVNRAISKINELFTNEYYWKMSMFNKSTTINTTARQTKEYFDEAYKSYKDLSADKILDLVLERVSPDDLFNYIISEQTSSHFIVRLLGRIIPTMVGPKKLRLEAIVEEQKDQVLNAKRVNISSAPGIEGMILRYGLKPYTLSMTADELFTVIGAEYNRSISIEDNCEKLAIAGPGVILINKSNNSPMEFSLDGLIDLDFITKNELITNPAAGLNKKMIKRFTTVKMLPRVKSATPVQLIPGKDQTWYIFETINGELWRGLSLYDVKIVPSANIYGIIKGLTTRPSEYNNIHSDIILSKCYDPKAQFILDDYSNFTARPTSTEIIKYKIIDEIVNNFTSRVASIKDSTVFKSSIDHTIIFGVIGKALKHSTGVYASDSVEYLITYMTKIDEITRVFLREFDRKMSDVAVPPETFTDSRKSRILVDIFKKTVSDSINELDKAGALSTYDMTLKEFFLERKYAVA